MRRCRVISVPTLASHIVVVGALLGSPAESAPLDFTSGIGQWSCRQFANELDDTGIQIAALHFATGYVSAMNTVSIVEHGTYWPMAKIKGSEMIGRMLAYCRTNLDMPLIAATDALLRTLPREPWVEQP